MTIKDSLELWAPSALSILRIVAAMLFLEHGTQKLLGFPARGHIPAMLSLSWIAGVLELVGGVLLVLGLFTRPVAWSIDRLLAGPSAGLRAKR